MAKKTKFVRIATSGNTIDGRKIDPTMLKQAAKNFNRETYRPHGGGDHYDVIDLNQARRRARAVADALSDLHRGILGAA